MSERAWWDEKPHYGWGASKYSDAKREIDLLANELLRNRMDALNRIPMPTQENFRDDHFDVKVERDELAQRHLITVRHRPTEKTLRSVVPQLEVMTARHDVIHERIVQLKRELLTQKENDMDEVQTKLREVNARLQADLKRASTDHATAEAELQKYKRVCKQLTVALERARLGDRGGMQVEGAIRAAALEQASEWLMDHGVITTGAELERVCQEISELPPREECNDIPH